MDRRQTTERRACCAQALRRPYRCRVRRRHAGSGAASPSVGRPPAVCRSSGFGMSGLVGIDEQQRRVSRSGSSSCKQLQPLGAQLDIQEGDAGDVAARPVEARDETSRNRIAADHEDDRDRRGCRLCRERRSGARQRDDHGTRRLTSSAANAGSRSYWPSAQRYSIATFWPST